MVRQTTLFFTDIKKSQTYRLVTSSSSAVESKIHHMKISRLSCVCIFSLTSLLAFADDNRTWTDAASGRKLEGSIESKSNDGSEVKVKRKDNGKSVTLKTTSLVGEGSDLHQGMDLASRRASCWNTRAFSSNRRVDSGTSSMRWEFYSLPSTRPGMIRQPILKR